jgi:hypothetical protein
MSEKQPQTDATDQQKQDEARQEQGDEQSSVIGSVAKGAAAGAALGAAAGAAQHLISARGENDDAEPSASGGTKEDDGEAE